jgi:hypothetical protein
VGCGGCLGVCVQLIDRWMSAYYANPAFTQTYIYKHKRTSQAAADARKWKEKAEALTQQLKARDAEVID